MKYFAKYLPVDTINERKDWNKVKLFLCSRDIQVGDKAFCTSPDHFGGYWKLERYCTIANNWIVQRLDENIGTRLDTKELIKIICEVSPESTWVKEGDEFDEIDIKAIHKL